MVSYWKKYQTSTREQPYPISKDSTCKAETRIKIATAVMAKLSRVLRSSIGFPTSADYSDL